VGEGEKKRLKPEAAKVGLCGVGAPPERHLARSQAVLVAESSWEAPLGAGGRLIFITVGFGHHALNVER